MNETFKLAEFEKDCQGLPVLFLANGNRTAFFQSLFVLANAKHNWVTRVLATRKTEALWQKVVKPNGSFIPSPDFSRTQAWEQDVSTGRELDEFIAACEQHNKISAARVILSGATSIGIGFSRANFCCAHDRIARLALADNSAPLKIVRRMFNFARETLVETRPSLLIAGEWSDPLHFVFLLAARKLGILCVSNRNSMLWNDRCYWSDSVAMYNDAARDEAERRRSVGAEVSEKSLNYISDFRMSAKCRGDTTGRYRPCNWRGRNITQINLLRIVRESIAAGGRGRGPAAKPADRKLNNAIRRKWLSFRQAGYFKRYTEAELRGKRFILMSLHEEPDQALNYQAYFWSHQYNVVSLLSSSLPDGYSLLVRDHPGNSGRRPTRYYMDLSVLPAVEFIDGFDDRFKYIRNADLVVTDNGQVGWEGLLLGRPVLTLSQSFYDGAGLAQRVRIHDDLSATVLEMVHQTAARPEIRDHALGCMLDAELETSAPDDPAHICEVMELLKKRFSSLSRTKGE